jgi:hypothetical protein
MSPTLKRVALFELFDKDATAVAVEIGYEFFPRVARSSQPWAAGCNPVGIDVQRCAILMRAKALPRSTGPRSFNTANPKTYRQPGNRFVGVLRDSLRLSQKRLEPRDILSILRVVSPDVRSRMNWQTRKSLTLSVLLAVPGIAALFSYRTIAANPPQIDYIETLSTNLIVIHFDTAANKVYHLQRTLDLNGGMESASWIDIYEAPELPFPNHYVVVDYRTNSQGFYRLKVTN